MSTFLQISAWDRQTESISEVTINLDQVSHILRVGEDGRALVHLVSGASFTVTQPYGDFVATMPTSKAE
jgi:hypothetical protein